MYPGSSPARGSQKAQSDQGSIRTELFPSSRIELVVPDSTTIELVPGSRKNEKMLLVPSVPRGLMENYNRWI